MLHIFADISDMRDGLLAVEGKDYNHIRNVLRMRPGEELTVRGIDENGRQKAYLFVIGSFSETAVLCRLQSVQEEDVELPVRVLLFQGLPKADKMDLIVQKSVETGAAEIIPVEMHRSIVKLTGDKRKKRIARWQAVAEAAAKQSGRAFVPEVHDVLPMRDALRYAADQADVILVPYEGMARTEGTRSLLDALQPGQTIAVFIGPEGGFEPSEIEAAAQAGARTISLGRRILRTETAGPAFLALLIYRFEL